MCLAGVALTGIEAGHIVIMLLGVCYFLFSEIYFENIGRGILEALHILLLCCTFIYEPVISLFPIAFFMGTKKRLYVSGAVTCVVYVYFFLLKYDPQVIMTLMLCALALVAELMSEESEKDRKVIISLRDSSKEREIGLEEENRLLAKNRDMMVKNATLSERNRIAREIHDNVGHMLTRSILQLGAIRVINKDETVDGALESLKETLDNAMTSIRTSVHDLHDESVDLAGALANILSEVSGFETKLEVDLENSQEASVENGDENRSIVTQTGGTVPRQIKYAFIAIAREAVNNTVKHSNGDEIAISVREHPGYWRLEITDNGKGAGLIERGKGIGLEGMEERARAIGALLRIDDSNGFRIIVTAFKNKNDGHKVGEFT